MDLKDLEIQFLKTFINLNLFTFIDKEKNTGEIMLPFSQFNEMLRYRLLKLSPHKEDLREIAVFLIKGMNDLKSNLLELGLPYKVKNLSGYELDCIISNHLQKMLNTPTEDKK